MSKPVARKGNMHVCPLHGIGTIVDGSPTTKVEGQPAARVGDIIVCSDSSIAIILKNNSCVSVDNKHIARKGDMISHGGIITTGAKSVTAADGDIRVVMGRNLTPIDDGKFRLYINSADINIHRDMQFGKDEISSDAALAILAGLSEEVIGIVLAATEVGASEEIILNIVGAKNLKPGPKIIK